MELNYIKCLPKPPSISSNNLKVIVFLWPEEKVDLLISGPVCGLINKPCKFKTDISINIPPPAYFFYFHLLLL